MTNPEATMDHITWVTIRDLVDKAYKYEDADHWRLPWDTVKLSYRFTKGVNS